MFSHYSMYEGGRLAYLLELKFVKGLVVPSLALEAQKSRVTLDKGAAATHP